MANRHKGQVALNVGDREYKLSFSVNAIADLENALDLPIAQIAASANSPEKLRIGTIRALLWASLQDHHDGVSMKDAGVIASDVISESGVPALVDAVGRAFTAAFPDVEGDEARPPKAAKAG